MTTIVYNPATGELAADHRVTWEPTGFHDHEQKIKYGLDFILASSGSTGAVERLIADMGGDLSMVPLAQMLSAQHALDNLNANSAITNVTLFALGPNDEEDLYELFASGIFHNTGSRDIYGMGSGAQYAIGAITAGASVREAIDIASMYCNGTSKSCTVIKPYDYLRALKYHNEHPKII